MSKKNFINYSLELGIKSWLKFICKRINIKNLEIILDNNLKDNIKKLYLKANNLIYKNIYINKIKININDFKLHFNYKKLRMYSNNMIIDCFIEIDNSNLEKIFFTSKWQDIRTQLQNKFTEGNNILNLHIDYDLIDLNYQINNILLKKTIRLKSEENKLYLLDVKDKKKVLIPLDKNIQIKNCLITNKLINIELTSKVTFDN